MASELGKDSLDRTEILLVDDRPENLLALEAVLSHPSYHLIKVGSGDDALRYLLTHEPAVILMDVQMPGLDGYDTAAIIKKSERTREIPIIFVTAINKDEKYVHKGYDYGAVDYIYKPFDAHILRAKVAVFAEMRRHQARMSRLVGVQESATRALAEASELKEAIPKVLKAVCTSLEWDLGTFWVFDKRSGTLCCQAEWHAPGTGLSEFLAVSFEKNYIPGVGLPWRVWHSKKTLWVTDITKEDSPRVLSAARAKLCTAVLLPVSFQEEVWGVLEFFSKKKLSDDPHLVKIMGAIGSQLGQVLSRARAFERVRAEEARKAAILETALDGVVSLDIEGKILEFNPAAEAAFGRRRADVIGKVFADLLIPERYRDDHLHGLSRYLASGNEGESRMLGCRVEIAGVRVDGAEFPLELTITRIEGVDPPQFTGFLRDITERKRTERNSLLLAEASAALSSHLDYQAQISTLARLSVQSLANWCVLDLQTGEFESRLLATAHRDAHQEARLQELFAEVRAVNPGPLAVLHSSVTDSVLTELWRDPQHGRWAQSLGLESLISVPLTARGKCLGTMIFVSADAHHRYDERDFAFAKELAGRAALAIDNARLYHEAQVAISARDEFFSVASHELKTPITSLKMQIELTKRSIKLDTGAVPSAERLAKMLGTSERQVDRLTHLVEELLDVVKIRAGRLNFELAELNLSALVNEALDSYAEVLTSAGCAVELEAEPDVSGAWDRGRIEQVVVNLITNAAKYAPGKPLKISVSRRGEWARLVVQDSGPGIPADRQGKIFERFERAISSRNISGLGLGLFIAKQIVEAHHGTITVQSREGEGATFLVELPLHSVHSLRTQDAASKLVTPEGTETVNWRR